MNNTNKSGSKAISVSCGETDQCVRVGIDVNKAALIHIRHQLDSLLTDSSQPIGSSAADYLANPNQMDQVLLEGWAKCGRNDRRRSAAIDLNQTLRTTVSPLGRACLIAYCRAWLDEAEFSEQQGQQSGQPPSPFPDGGRTRQQSDLLTESLARESARRIQRRD
jgi:hypothetical protein